MCVYVCLYVSCGKFNEGSRSVCLCVSMCDSGGKFNEGSWSVGAEAV